MLKKKKNQTLRSMGKKAGKQVKMSEFPIHDLNSFPINEDFIFGFSEQLNSQTTHLFHL